MSSRPHAHLWARRHRNVFAGRTALVMGLVLALAAAMLSTVPAGLLMSRADAAVTVPTPDVLDVDFSATGPVDHVKGRTVSKAGTPSYAVDPTLNVYTGTYDGTTPSTDAFDVADSYTGAPSVLASFTTECVFKWNGSFAPADTQNVCSGRNGGGFGFFTQSGKSNITFSAYINGAQKILPYPSQSLTPGAWYDAVGTFDGQSLKLYVNGVLASQTAVTGTLTPPTNIYQGAPVTPLWNLGADWTPKATVGESGAPVTIAASRVWSSALTAGEITELTKRFNLGGTLADTTAPVISTPGSSQILVGSAFDPMTGVTASDNVDGNLTSSVTVSGAVDTTKVGQYTLVYSVTDAAGNKGTATRVISVSTEMPMTATPLFDVDFAAGTAVENITGKLPKTVFGTPAIAEETVLDKPAASFDGVDDAYLYDFPQWSQISKKLTVDCTFRLNATLPAEPTHNICASHEAGGYAITVTSSKVRWSVYIGGAYRTVTAPVKSNRWYHAALTYDGAVLRGFLDGAEVGDIPIAGTIGLPSGTARTIAIGADTASNNRVSDFADVTVSGNRVWDAVAEPAQIAALADGALGDRDSAISFGETAPAEGAHVTKSVTFNPAIKNQGNATDWTYLLDGAAIQPGQHIGGIAAGNHTIAISATDVFGTPISHEIHFTSDDLPMPGTSGTNQGNGTVRLSAVATDPDDKDVTVTFRKANAQAAEGGVQGVVQSAPTSLEFTYTDEASVNGTLVPDDKTADSTSTSDVPFQRFDITAAGTSNGRRIDWSGVVDPERIVSLRVWNLVKSQWDVIGETRGSADGQTSISGVVSSQHVDSASTPAVVHALVVAEDPFADDLSDRTAAAAADKDHFDTATDDTSDGTAGKNQFSFVHWTDPQYINAGAARTEDPSVGGVSLPNVGALTTWPHVPGATESLDEAAVWAASYQGAVDWTAKNAKSQRIAWAAMTGDMAQNYNYDNQAKDGAGNLLHPGAPDQFAAELRYARKAVSKIKAANIPYQVIAGNHDNLNGSNDTPFADTFKASDFYEESKGWGTDWVGKASYHTMDEDPDVTGTPSGPGTNGQGVSSQNSYELFSAGGLDFVSVGLAYGVTSQEAEWARKVFAKYRDRNGILTTHSYLNASGNADGREATMTADGSALYNATVAASPNVFLVLAGHVHGVGTNLKKDIGATVDTKHNVVELLADYQNYRLPASRVFTAERCTDLGIPCRWGTLNGESALDVDNDGSYDHLATDELWFGASFLRLLQFNTKSSTMSVDTYSPFLEEFGNYPNDDQKRYNASADNFTVPVDLTSRRTSFSTDSLVLSTPTDTVIAAPVTVPSGTVASVDWGRLVPGQLYSWTAGTTGDADFGGVFVATEAGAGPGWKAPVLETPGDATVDEGANFDPLKGVKATDDLDGDLTASVTVTGWPGGTPEQGVYELIYTVTDSWGNQTQSSRTVTVKKVVVPPKVSTKVQANDVSMRQGETLPLSASVSPAAASGTVSFSLVDSEQELLCQGPVTDGEAGCELSGVMLAPGTYRGVAKFAGDEGFEDSESRFTLTVAPKAVTNVSGSASAWRYGQPGRVNVTVTGGSVPTGVVELTDAHRSLGKVALAGGLASFVISRTTLTPGRHVLTATYAGDSTHAASRVQVAVRVAKAAGPRTIVRITKKPTSTAKGRAAVTVATPSGLRTPTGKVRITFKKNGRTIVRTATLRAGRTNVALPRLPQGKWRVTVKYLGSSVYGTSHRALNVRVKK